MSIVNKAVVSSLFEEVWNNQDYSFIPQLFDPRYTNRNSLPRFSCGADGYQMFVEMYHRAFPDLYIRIEAQIVEGDLVTTRWIANGTNTGEFMGMAATQQSATFTGIQIDRIDQGKIVESWMEHDLFGVMYQIGVLPIEP